MAYQLGGFWGFDGINWGFIFGVGLNGMGTRALIHIKSEGRESDTLVTIYRQCDGYIDGLGKEIYELLNNGNVTLLNGFGDHKHPEFFNGMGDLAPYLIKHLKQEIGNVYIYRINSEAINEEYTYMLYTVENELMIQVTDIYAEKIYVGKLSMFPVILEQWTKDCEAR